MKLYSILVSACLLLAITSITAQVPPPPDSAQQGIKIFTKVDVEASFTDGDLGWLKYLKKNLNADVPSENGSPAGLFTVIVKFIVGKDGKLSDVAAETNQGFGMEKEVIRIIKNSGAWIPAMMDGKPVNAYRRQPVTFMVQNDGIDIISKVPYTLFTGVDNEVTIKADKIKSENLNATISQGSITPKGNGIFIVKVSKPGRVTITATNAKKEDREIGAVSFEVKPVTSKL